MAGTEPCPARWLPGGPATAGTGGATAGFARYRNGGDVTGADRSSTTGWTVGAQQSLRAGTPGITCNSPGCDPRDDLDEETVPVIGASCAPGGGFSAFAEDLALETTSNGGADDEALPTSGVTPPF